jgi:UDPglucose 6-dehydrogenase
MLLRRLQRGDRHARAEQYRNRLSHFIAPFHGGSAERHATRPSVTAQSTRPPRGNLALPMLAFVEQCRRVSKQLSFFGLGKLGLPLAALFARSGMPTLAIDTDSRLIERLRAGRAPSDEPGLPDLLVDAAPMIAFGRDARGAAETIASIILVATPSDSTCPQFSSEHVEQACRDLCAALRQRRVWRHHLFVISSTIAPGAIAQRIIPLLERALDRTAGRDFSVAYVPDFVALGQVVRGFQSPPFLLVGADDERSGARAAALYHRIIAPTTPIRTLPIRDVELAKIAYNTFLCLKISFANLLAQVGDRLGGADLDAIAGVLALDPRIGPGLLRAGAPYGGPCLPRDIDALLLLTRSLGLDAPLAQATAAVNAAQFDLIEQHLLVGNPRCVAVLGLSFKPGTPVIIGSPGITLIERLNARAIPVVAFDPSTEARARARALPGLMFSCRETLEDACAAGDTILVANADPAFEHVGTMARSHCRIIDPWGCVRDHHPGLVRIGRLPRSQTAITRFGLPRGSEALYPGPERRDEWIEDQVVRDGTA